MNMSFPYVIVWLDRDAANPENSFREQLGSNLQTFTDKDKCLQFIQSHSSSSIYLITSGSFAKQIVPEIFEIFQVVRFYILCGSILSHIEWAVDYDTQILMFEHGDDLLERLWTDLQLNLRQKGTLFFEEADACKNRAAQYRQTCG